RVADRVPERQEVPRVNHAMDLSGDTAKQVGVNDEPGVLQNRLLDEFREAMGRPVATVLCREQLVGR
ncbi:MAG: hypothetical protein AAFR01_08175, partial [Pseudomonadota bacterium]